ncbi:hypothetical protein TWF506_005472 [Arthrobotrys conoides]|uniref:Uncharacterized protein n=1 Tax=Arthrobotrys conoides TaxID=74498 RepID=A0AAN8P6T5_9PEZI
MSGGLNKRLKPVEKTPNSVTQSNSIQNPRQKDSDIPSTTSNQENMDSTNSRDNMASGSPSKTLDEAPSSKTVFTFNSPQEFNVDFQYQEKASATGNRDANSTAVTSNQGAKAKVQAVSIFNTDTKRQASSGVNVALENAILLDDNYTLPRGPKSSTKSNSMSTTVKLPVPPGKKFVKFVMPYRGESTPSSFDNISGPSRDGLQTNSYAEGPKKKKKKSVFATLGVVDRASIKSKECVLTPSALVDLKQLKLGVAEHNEQLNSIEQQLLEVTQVIQNLQDRVKASELENTKLRRDFNTLKSGKKSNDNEVDDEDDESEQIKWKIQRICHFIIIIMILYLAVAYWAT